MNGVPAGAALGRRILYDQFVHTREDVDRHISSAVSSARSIPLVAAADTGLIGAYGLTIHEIPLNWLFVVLAVAASILVAGFFACVELTTVVFESVLLADLEQRLGVPYDKGYFLGDLAGHHVGRSEPRVSEVWNRRVLRVRLRSPWIRNAALMPIWAAAVTAAVGDAALFVFAPSLLLLVPILAGIGVFFALTGVVKASLASLPASVIEVLRNPDDWFSKRIPA